MSKRVLDSSAILAAVLAEPGGDLVGPMFASGIVSAVNVAVPASLRRPQRLGIFDHRYDIEPVLSA